MNPRIATGKGITGALRYVQGEGRDPVTNKLIKPAPGQKGRATLIGSTGFGVQITTAEGAEKARRFMEFLAARATAKPENASRFAFTWCCHGRRGSSRAGRR